MVSPTEGLLPASSARPTEIVTGNAISVAPIREVARFMAITLETLSVGSLARLDLPRHGSLCRSLHRFSFCRMIGRDHHVDGRHDEEREERADRKAAGDD